MIIQEYINYLVDLFMQFPWHHIFISSGIGAIIATIIVNFTKAKWESRLRGDLETKLESFKSELRRDEDLIKARFSSNENEINTIRSTLLSELSLRKSVSDRRKLEAIEKIWSQTIELNKLLGLAKMAEGINIKYALKTASEAGPNKEKIQEFAKILLVSSKVDQDYVSKLGCELERLYVPPEVWYVFKTYLELLIKIFVELKAMELGTADLLNKSHTNEMCKSLKILLPHMTKFIDDNKEDAYVFLASQVRERLFDELKKAVDGDAVSDSSLDDIKKIASAVRTATEFQKIDIPDIAGLRKNINEQS